MKNKNIMSRFGILVLVFVAVLLALPMPLRAAAITRTVCSTCTGTNQYQKIGDALFDAVDGDTINVYANTAGYAEQITITKRVTLNGLTSSGQPAWGTAAGNSNGPVIKYINGYPQMMSFQANYIEMKGFAIESITGGTPLNTVNCINMEGPAPLKVLKGITMTYNTITMGPKRTGISVNNNHTLQNATISNCKFISPITMTDADSSWFYVGEGSNLASGDGGAINWITLTTNEITQTTSRLQLDNNIQNITYSKNIFNHSNGYILLEEPTDQTTSPSYKFQNIKILTNTFNDSNNNGGSSIQDEYAVMVASNVEDGDVATSWTTDLVINYNKFLQGAAGGRYPIVGFQTGGGYTTPINAQFNWWNNRQGPRSFGDASGLPSTTPDISANVDYSPWMGKTFVSTPVPMDWYTNDEIQPAVNASTAGDIIYVISNTTAYRESLNINKQLSLIGKKTNFASARGTTGYNSGPIIKYDSTKANADMIKFNASGIAMEGFKIDAAGDAVKKKGVYFNGTISNPTITYCSFNIGENSPGDPNSQDYRGISIDGGAIVKNATISNCSFIGAITSCAWFIVDGSASGAGGLEGATLSNNKIDGATSELQLSKTIKDVTYSNNTFDNANGYIRLSEPVEQSTNKFSNIKFDTNTFNSSKRPSEYAVLVSANVDYNDVASNDWSNLLLSFNKFWQTDKGGIYPNVGFETVSDQITTKINAKENWWGTSLGPTRAAPGPTPKVRISQMVDFQPWLGTSTTTKNKEYVRFNDGSQDMVFSETIQGAIDASPISGGGLVFVKPGSYDETLNITQQNIKLIGKKSDGTTNAWTNNIVGSSTDAPSIRGTVNLKTDKIELKGFNLDASNTNYAVYAGSPSTPTIFGISITYCSFILGSNKGVAIDNGNTAKDLLVGYCKFTGATNSSWFYIGDGTTGGSIDTGAWGYGARLLHNDITQASADLRLSRSIKNVQFTNNTFNNTANGYITLEKPSSTAVLIQGITITHNTFNNSTQGFLDEYAVVVRKDVFDSNTNGWDKNLTLYFNNFLQDDADSRLYPIVGFEDSSLYTPAMDTKHNWWNSTSGPRSFEFDTGVSPTPDVSLNAGFNFDVPSLNNYSRAKIIGGIADIVKANVIKTITDTSINLDLAVQTKTSGQAPVFAAKYDGIPIAITTGLSGGATVNHAFYDILVYPSSASNIHDITATFNISASASSVYWYNAISATWLPWGTSYKNTVSGKPQVWATASSWPSISQLSGTPICIKGAGTTTTSILGTTTTSVSSATTAATSSTTSAAVTTTTSISGTTTVRITTSSSVKPNTTTTTTAPQPKLTITPVSLNYGADKIVQTFAITNTGPGTLQWNINKDQINYNNGTDWIFDITPASGETNTEQDTVTVTISRAGLDPGTYSASIPVSSNGGDKSLSITMEVAAAEEPVLSLNPTVLYLKNTDASGAVDIANTGSGTLVWKLGDPVYVNGNGINWISGVTPSSGTTAQEKVTVTISVNRDRLRGGIYIANIPLTSNGGNRTLGVVMFVARDSQQYPRTKVDPFLVFLKKGDTVKTFTITNAGTGTLVWQLGAVKYQQQQQGWITSVSPLSGETTTDVATITVNADTSVLKQGGLYGATIPVMSNGGNRNVLIYIWVPLLQYQ